MHSTKQLDDIQLDGKRVCLRVDYNVPFDEKGAIADDSRITATLPTIKYLMQKGCSIVLLSHLGRPKGKVDKSLSLKPVAEHLSALLGKPVEFISDIEPVRKLEKGEIVMLENLRFYPGEEKPESDLTFANKLKAWGDAYVNDAFAVSHRKHTSVWSLPKLFSGDAAAGLLLEKELEHLNQITTNPKRPFFAVIGGSKVSTKLGVIEALLKKVDGMMVGGGLAYTFLKAKGIDIGSSLVEDDLLEKAKETLTSAEAKGIELLLPVDLLVSDDIDGRKEAKVVSAIEGVPKGASGVSIGPETVKLWREKLAVAGTVFWNGPLGIYEMEPYQGPTIEFARRLGELKSDTGALTVAGGGDCIAAIHKARVSDQFSYLSTGGGATLELLEFGTLPGVDALSD